MRQAQLELKPFDSERLKAVAVHLRELHPARDRGRLEFAVSDESIQRMVEDVTAGFKGDVGVVPRQFLREFVTQMDLVDENENYRPAEQYGFQPKELSPEEQTALSGTRPSGKPDSDDLVPLEDAW
jgi:hypothetical protein